MVRRVLSASKNFGPGRPRGVENRAAPRTLPSVTVETIRFPGHERQEIQGLLARPDGVRERGGPGIVLVQEVFGIDGHIRQMSGRFADEGFVVIAPDLYSREGVPGPKPTRDIPEPVWSMDEVRAAVQSLPDRRVLGDLEGALDHLAGQPGVDARKLGGSASAWGATTPTCSVARAGASRPSSISTGASSTASSPRGSRCSRSSSL